MRERARETESERDWVGMPLRTKNKGAREDEAEQTHKGTKTTESDQKPATRRGMEVPELKEARTAALSMQLPAISCPQILMGHHSSAFALHGRQSNRLDMRIILIVLNYYGAIRKQYYPHLLL